MPNPIQVQRSFVWIIQKPGDKIAIKLKTHENSHVFSGLDWPDLCKFQR